jgi:hypothetical protein
MTLVACGIDHGVDGLLNVGKGYGCHPMPIPLMTGLPRGQWIPMLAIEQAFLEHFTRWFRGIVRPNHWAWTLEGLI